ncbi:unannotated protein [freshwater metagenome]|uniref:Unannotated protein n=1 Tax=freshwater metagenome TaxID=449393 RepID=A0A6J7IE75_9ZZZZ
MIGCDHDLAALLAGPWSKEPPADLRPIRDENTGRGREVIDLGLDQLEQLPPRRPALPRVELQGAGEHGAGLIAGAARCGVCGHTGLEGRDERGMRVHSRRRVVRIDDRITRSMTARGHDRAEPCVELHRGLAVEPVVGTDTGEDLGGLVGPALQAKPDRSLELDDRVHGGSDVTAGMADPVHALDVLQRQRLRREAQRPADQGVQVDEAASAQQQVKLSLTGTVLLRQSRQRAPLIVGVVIHVHPRVSGPPLHDDVDEPLECRALADDVVRFGRVEVEGPGGEESEPEHVLKAPAIARIGVALHVEPKIARTSRGQACEDDGIGHLVQHLTGPLTANLEI